MSELTKHKGSCHCGAVTYEVAIDASKGTRCNCSVCTKTGPTNGVVKPDAFKLLGGQDQLSAYGWRTMATPRFFCKTCGVQIYGTGDLPELGGAFVAVNLLTLDDVDVGLIKVVHWDGRHDNWQAGPRETPWPSIRA